MNLKKNTGYEAAKEVLDGQVVGLGTGSTTHYFIEKLGMRIKEEDLDIMGIPTSYQSFFLANDCNIPVTTLEEHDIDLAVDGADEVDPALNLIKGGGAAHTLEKIIDYSADRFIVIVDDSKMVETLGKFPVPLEVIPTAARVVSQILEDMGVATSIRMAERKDGPVITDNGNFVIDAEFGILNDPEELEIELNSIPGVVENGIFSGVVDQVFVGTPDGIKKI
ncbi:MAG: ribose 5-phosphate isomerase A [Methanobacteriales archaeon HGW-Methanobacteriales-1]|jgi:ribose 5-phosphate isomerase A|nr:MAG: ribose 5-phosphate isomerase A [Methanobacteriales archaeon HGW-Methanobacteriales-1]